MHIWSGADGDDCDGDGNGSRDGVGDSVGDGDLTTRST